MVRFNKLHSMTCAGNPKKKQYTNMYLHISI